MGVEGKLDRLATLIADSPHNLVSRGERPHVRERHIDEAVAVAAALPVEPGQRWLDLGTGGGLPGLVLAVLHPDTRFVLLDSVAKKTEAVHGFAAALDLTNVLVVTARAERLAHDPAHRGTYDTVISRAVAPLIVVAELSRGFLRPGGLVVAVKGPRWAAEVEHGRSGLPLLGLGPATTLAVDATRRPTWLVTMRADGPCPPQYPRREGIPRAQPLGETSS